MKELIIKAKSGDKGSVEKIIKLFQPLIYKTSIKYYIYGYDTEDLKQIAIMTVIKSIKKIKEDSLDNFPAYLKIAIKNAMTYEIEKATNRYYEEKEKRRGITLIEAKEIIDESIDISKSIIDKELLENLNNIIKNMEIKEQKLIRKLYIEKVSLSGYAKIEKIEYHKARYLKDKVIEKIRKELMTNK
ncbi:sigma-70 family RNA polymerase sigma factor [Clostridium sp.]|uniref:sigma-70 family RNA polymerase sigma factor n=1 Tax=Clostridium sp. TaxID=1506 RepID=UPI00260EAC75|nr:sigma-70 family RNA polymerase sigma factor [Clostridium sp.]